MRRHIFSERPLGRILAWALWIFPMGLFAQTTFYNTGQIQRIEIQFSQPNWDYRMDTAKAGAETYLMADWVKINGIRYDSAGVKYKGNSSYDSTLIKNPLNIGLDEFKNQAHEGFTTIKLGNCYADPSMIREVMSYDILSNYMHAPQANFAQVYVNGNYWGLYSNAENINKEFCSTHFYSSSGTFFKCNPIGIPGPTTKSNLKTIVGVDSTGYFPRYELKSTTGWNELVDLCNVVTNTPAALPASMDMDRVIWMLAFNNLLVNLDSYSGVFAQNYYLYKDQNDRFNPIVWDLNMSFGGFPFLGGGATGMGSLTVSDMEQLALDAHSTDPYWPLINAVMSNARSKRKYVAHLRTIADEMFTSGQYAVNASNFQTLIDTAVSSDANKFYSYTQFQNGLTASAPNGAYTIPGIGSLMTARLSYLQGTPEFGYVPPVITSPLATPAFPAFNDTVIITAQVSGADSVFLGYRSYQALKFASITMLDDGLHGDGAANDGVFAAEILQNSGVTQYYIYAENATAGAFSPARAEHEFHSVQTALNFPSPGDLVINEFLAVNQTGQMDETGQFEDWIELFNNTQSALSLTGLYLTDDVLNPTKCALPSGTTIAPQGLLVIWADQDASSLGVIHCNFKLSSLGESIKLSNGSNITFDSLTFGPQTADVSLGRCPDGTGAFSAQPAPSFNALNCGVQTQEFQYLNPYFVLSPNPSSERVQILCEQRFVGNLEVFDHLGRPILTSKWTGNTELNINSWSTGIYFIRLGLSTKKLVVAH